MDGVTTKYLQRRHLALVTKPCQNVEGEGARFSQSQQGFSTSATGTSGWVSLPLGDGVGPVRAGMVSSGPAASCWIARSTPPLHTQL